VHVPFPRSRDELIDAFDHEVMFLADAIAARLRHHRGYQAIQAIRHDRDRIAARRGRSIGKVTAARRLLTLVYYGLRDGHIRCLQPTSAVA
jgi:hypothetical protein